MRWEISEEFLLFRVDEGRGERRGGGGTKAEAKAEKNEALRYRLKVSNNRYLYITVSGVSPPLGHQALHLQSVTK